PKPTGELKHKHLLICNNEEHASLLKERLETQSAKVGSRTPRGSYLDEIGRMLTMVRHARSPLADAIILHHPPQDEEVLAAIQDLAREYRGLRVPVFVRTTQAEGLPLVKSLRKAGNVNVLPSNMDLEEVTKAIANEV